MPLRLIHANVWSVLTEAAKQSNGPAYAAVAFWGAGGSKLLPLKPQSSLVVDASPPTVAGGQTCPADLLNLYNIGVNIFSSPNLHAKVYAFPKVAYVGSANVSKNSANILTEAILGTNSPIGIKAARHFVLGLCKVKLDDVALKQLASIYHPPKHTASNTATKANTTLLMELTDEQGAKRRTQVQPPLSVWRHYFQLESFPGMEVSLKLRSVKSGSTKTSPHRVVPHDHVYTIEIPEAAPLAILKVLRRPNGVYDYLVYRKSDPEFKHLRWLLDNIHNPLRHKGRKWITV